MMSQQYNLTAKSNCIIIDDSDDDSEYINIPIISSNLQQQEHLNSNQSNQPPKRKYTPKKKNQQEQIIEINDENRSHSHPNVQNYNNQPQKKKNTPKKQKQSLSAPSTDEAVNQEQVNTQTIQELKPKKKYTKKNQTKSANLTPQKTQASDINSKRKYQQYNSCQELDDQEYSQTVVIEDSHTEMLDQSFNQESQDELNKSSQQDSLKSTPKKKQKIEVQGPFEMADFEWYQSKDSPKLFMKINKKEIKNINPNLYDQSEGNNQLDDLGKQIHANIKIYVDTNNKNYFTQFLQDSNKVDYICYHIDKTIEYLKLKGMNKIHTEYSVYYTNYKKVIDLIAFNEEKKECVIIDWKYSKITPESQISTDLPYHFIQQLKAVQHTFQDYSVTLMIIPLQNIRNLRFIEFDEKEIRQLYDRLSKQSLLKSYIFKMKDRIKKNSCLNSNNEMLSIQQYANYLKSKSEIMSDELSHYKDLQNSLQYRNEDELSTEKRLSKFDKFYVLHILLTDQNNKSNQKHSQQQKQNNYNNYNNIFKQSFSQH